jgi:hypothetical protein
MLRRRRQLRLLLMPLLHSRLLLQLKPRLLVMHR